MNRVGVADLKSRLSHFLSLAKAGEQILITDRGKPVAKLMPLTRHDTEFPAHLVEMERLGELRLGTGQPPDEAADLERPKPRANTSAVQALIDERREGR